MLLKHMRNDFLELCLAITDSTLDQIDMDWHKGATLGVVLASENYPKTPKLNLPLPDASLPEDIKAFHAGTALKKGQLVNSGGRVYCVTTTQSSLEAARNHLYKHLPSLAWEGAHYRKDIGLQ